MGSPSSLREVRFLTGTTFNKVFSNAAESGWNAADNTAYKLRVAAYEDALTQDGLPDETLQTRMHSTPAPIEGLRVGTQSITAYAGGAWSNIETAPHIVLARDSLGGLVSARTGRTTTADAGGSTVNVPITDATTYCNVGMALKVGVKGDGGGDGQVAPINAVAATYAELSLALPGAPSAGDTVVISDTVHLDEDATQRYVDTVIIGHGTANQKASIGAAVVLSSITGMATGELPKMEFELTPADWKWLPSNERTSLTRSKTPQGTNPAFERGIGMVHIGDFGDSTRAVMKCGDLTFTPGVAHEPLPGPGGVNAIEGFQHMPGTPTAEATVLVDEDFGLVADFEGQTNKMVLFVMGHETGKTVAVQLPKANLTALPTSETLNNLAAMKITLQGTEDYTEGSDLESSAALVHFF